MKAAINCCILSLCIASTLSAQVDTQRLQSPNKTYDFEISTAGGLKYMIKYHDKPIIEASALGFDFDRGNNHAEIKIKNVVKENVDSSWRPVYGEKEVYPDAYNEMLIELDNPNSNIPKFNVKVRAYNEGIAFRYEFSNRNKPIHIKDELTEFAIPAGSQAWASNRAQSEIVKMPIDEIKEVVERPLLIELPSNYFLAIGEAALVDYARMKFALKKGRGSMLISKLSSSVTMDGMFHTPWRFIMAAKEPGTLIEHNYLILNLNEANKIEDTSWIKPGKVIREVTLTTQGGKACVDFAAWHNMQYIEFDAGWYGPESDPASDATTVTVDPKRSKGPLDLQKVIKYAKSKDVGVLLYVNRRALESQLDEVLPLLHSWGVAGLKYGFVQVGSQEWTSWLHEAVRKAADNQLMIDIHDEYRPTGYSRTYPNLMTQEGIRGDEESPDNAMVLNTLFTRMIAGAGDHTNCYLAERVDNKMGSHASQFAKSVIIYSPWQFLYWYDRPEGSPVKKGGAGGAEGMIPELPELEFYDALPTVWDDTRVGEGYPGSHAVVARKSGERWFVGALNGNESRQFNIKMDFLDSEKNYLAKIFSDDTSMKTRTNVHIEEIEVTSESILTRDVKKMNGLAMIISQK